jgi:hypothetical protein
MSAERSRRSAIEHRRRAGDTLQLALKQLMKGPRTSFHARRRHAVQKAAPRAKTPVTVRNSPHRACRCAGPPNGPSGRFSMQCRVRLLKGVVNPSRLVPLDQPFMRNRFEAALSRKVLHSLSSSRRGSPTAQATRHCISDNPCPTISPHAASVPRSSTKA